MSEDRVPEWKRLKTEIIAIWRGAWHAINELDDRHTELEKRVTEVEKEVRSPYRWRR